MLLPIDPCVSLLSLLPLFFACLVLRWACPPPPLPLLLLQETIGAKWLKLGRSAPLGACVTTTCKSLRLDPAVYSALYRGRVVAVRVPKC